MRPPSKNEGAALVMALLALLVLTLLGLSLTSMTMVTMTVSNNERDASDALYVADSGVAHATALLSAQDWASFDAFLAAGDGRGCTGDELAAPPAGAGSGYPAAAELIPATGRAFPPGSYRVSVCDDDALEAASSGSPGLPDSSPEHDANARVLIRSTGAGRDGATATIEAEVARVGLPAILVDGNLRINGNPSVMGEGGAVHANGSLDLIGSPCAQKYVSASGPISGGGSVAGGAACLPSSADVRRDADPIPVPLLVPASFRTRADFVLGADGLARNRAGAVVTLSDWSWSASSRTWSGGRNIPGGTYYVEGNVNIGGSPGSAGAPLALTVVSEGYVDITGSPSLMPALAGTPSYSVVAGTDLRLAGNPTTTYTGVFYAGDQVDFSGNPNVVGQVIAKNQGDLGYPPNPARPGENNLVRLQGGYMALSGNPRVSYDGGSGLGVITLVGWRECRGSDPDVPCGAP